MNIKTLLISIIPLLIALPVFAESKYPVIAGIEISETTTSAEYIAYAFSLLVAIGSFIAVVMVVIAAIEWMTSSGNPSKIESSKGKIKNAILGVGVLLGSYVILSTINPEITTVEIDDLVCDYGIIMKANIGTGEKQREVLKCIDQNTEDIDYEIIETVNKDAWSFEPGTLLKVYTFSETDYKGTIKTFDFSHGEPYSGEIMGAKSIYFLRYNPGIYIYDSLNFNIKDKVGPLYTTSSIANLSDSEFNDTAESIDVIQGNGGYDQYSFVAFTSQNYEGRCSFSPYSVENLNNAISETVYPDPININTLSSIIIKKTIIDMDDVSGDKGYIALYTKKSCGKTSVSSDGMLDVLGNANISSNEIKECKINIPNSPRVYNILDECSGEEGDENNFVSGDAVISFAIIGSAGVVFSTSEIGYSNSGTRCKYFGLDSLGSGTCYSSLIGSPVYTIGGVKPKSIIIIPGDK
ncbi:MAG: pilin [Candidatus Pacebacteria bacterium]|nr:pilin [Candidatus Paceibacterota bacterium]